jgi:hypothetical protein
MTLAPQRDGAAVDTHVGCMRLLARLLRAFCNVARDASVALSRGSRLRFRTRQTGDNGRGPCTWGGGISASAAGASRGNEQDEEGQRQTESMMNGHTPLSWADSCIFDRATARAPDTVSVSHCYSSRIAARTLATTSGGISLIPCATCACSVARCKISSSVVARTSKSQSMPTSLHRRIFTMVHLLHSSQGHASRVIPTHHRRPRR